MCIFLFPVMYDFNIFHSYTLRCDAYIIHYIENEWLRSLKYFCSSILHTHHAQFRHIHACFLFLYCVHFSFARYYFLFLFLFHTGLERGRPYSSMMQPSHVAMTSIQNLCNPSHFTLHFAAYLILGATFLWLFTTKKDVSYHYHLHAFL